MVFNKKRNILKGEEYQVIKSLKNDVEESVIPSSIYKIV